MQCLKILLVEDNPGDVILTREAIRESHLAGNFVLSHVSDGEAAISYLHREGSYKSVTRPDIIMLDLNLPKKSGFEVLNEVKGDPDLASIPIIILSTSVEESDIDLCYRSSANCYLSKPIGISSFIQLMSNLCNFWGNTVKLPENDLHHQRATQE